MLLTRSIRRKLCAGLGLVVLLFTFSAYCSSIGLNSCRRMVRDLDLSIQNVPRRSELVATLGDLLKPFRHEFPSAEVLHRQAAEWQFQEFSENFDRVRSQVDNFERNWNDLDDSLRHSFPENFAYTSLFTTVDSCLDRIGRGMHRLKNPETRTAQQDIILREVMGVITEIERLPDPANTLFDRLREARSDYSLLVRLVVGLGAMSVVLLIGLVVWGYNAIFAPLRKLHMGVRRIADGNYSYRLRITTQCEISELATAFNQMADRIQQEQVDQERAIQERSKQLVLSERLVGAGFLASGVAHEINNPLSVIMTAAYGLEMRLDSDVLQGLSAEDQSDVKEYLGLIQSEAERCERITKKLLDFSHGKGDEKNRYDVTAIVAEVVGMVGHLSRYQDRKVTVNRTSPLHAWVNAPEIKQVLLNLMANALDASQSGGEVQVQLAESPDELCISVRDFGSGMTPEQMQHIFEPFFTTKEVGKGTGLGLSITHRIVRDHGGTLEVQSDGPGQGSCFTLRLPKKVRQSKAA